ncbi:hypothetical protein E3P78_03531 [Wallemia ichthyophaga]|nr:hypothetical protein E3P78_03531 [Wallemia ichthyophaga]
MSNSNLPDFFKSNSKPNNNFKSIWNNNDALPTLSFTDSLNSFNQLDLNGTNNVIDNNNVIDTGTVINTGTAIDNPTPSHSLNATPQLHQIHPQPYNPTHTHPQMHSQTPPTIPPTLPTPPSTDQIIRHQELQDLKRRRKAIKISSMSNYNHLMTPSDKSYILRIQLSSLATADPYTDDFYAQIYSILMRKNQGVLNVGGMALSVAAGSTHSGIGIGAAKKLRDQIDKIVRSKRQNQLDDKNNLNQEKSLVGALGTSTKTNSRAPRQVLQIDSDISSESTKASAIDVLSSLQKGYPISSNSSNSPQPPLTRRQCLMASEKLYDHVLALESLARSKPNESPTGQVNEEDHVQSTQAWQSQYANHIDAVWKGLRVMEPLELSNPHPFISLIALPKTSKLLPRATRHLDHQQILTINTLIIACFSQLLSLQDSCGSFVEAFLSGVVPQFMSMIAGVSLRLVAGMLALFVERNDVVTVAQSKPGLAFLTILLSRAEILKQIPLGVEQAPAPEETAQWDQIFSLFLHKLLTHLPHLFPSQREKAARGFGGVPGVPAVDTHTTTLLLDNDDESVWRFLAAIALNSDNIQQSSLVQDVRDVVHENVVSAQQAWVPAQSAHKRISNVNVFLHALGLDVSQLGV